MSDTKSHQKASASASNPGAGGESADARANTATSTSTYKPPSKYRFVKDGWGGRTNFQLSHGLKMDPDGLEEGRVIIEAYIEQQRIQNGDLAYEDRKGIPLDRFAPRALFS